MFDKDMGGSKDMEMYQNGVRVYCLPDDTICIADEEGRNPLDLQKCPCGYKECSRGCAWYSEVVESI